MNAVSHKINSLQECMKYAAREGNVDDIQDLCFLGINNLEEGAVESSKNGNLDATMFFIKNGASSFKDMYVASSFGGNKAVTKAVTDTGYIPNQKSLDGYLIGAVSCGSRKMIDHALKRGARVTAEISYVLNPDSSIFDDLVGKFSGMISFKKVFISCARSSTLTGVMKAFDLIEEHEYSPAVANEAYIQALYGNNTDVVAKLKSCTDLSDRDKYRVVMAAGHSGMLSVLNEHSDYVDSNVVNESARSGKSEVVIAYIDKITPVTEGYIAYSGDVTLLDNIGATSVDMICCGAARSGNVSLLETSLEMMEEAMERGSQEFLLSLLIQAVHSRNIRVVPIVIAIVKEYVAEMIFSEMLKTALGAKKDELFPLIPSFNLTEGIYSNQGIFSR